jgi:thiamine pyrophosphokinase
MTQNNNSYIAIVADGVFPLHEKPLEYLRNATRIICCDGGTENLVLAGYVPDAIVGDMDSISEEIADRFAEIIFKDDDQDINDLTKAVRWCSESGYKDIVILGATGLREDHTIGNISLLTEYIKDVNVIMVTDTGIFQPFLKGCTVSSFPGQQVSVFSIDPETEITSAGLRYPLYHSKILNWWVATLNETLGDSFTLDFEVGKVIVYMKFNL